MRWMLALVLFPALALASEECVAQLGGRCRSACEPDEKPEQGAFIDCTEKERCCAPGPARKSPSASPTVVLIDQMAFSPQVTKVKVGTEVVWKNNDASLHTVTGDGGSFSSPPLDEGETFKKVFAERGTYTYTCEMHPFMSGSIVVE
jgi:plastocyanin